VNGYRYAVDVVSLLSRRNRQMAKHPRSLTGKVAVVTGGGRGIGRAIAAAFVGKGMRVAIGDVDRAAAEASAAELGPNVVGLHLDVTDLTGFSAFLDEVETRVGPIDVLVNNAGIMPITSLEKETDASITRQLEINLRAVIHGTQEAMRRMRPRQTGHIVNIASLAGKNGYANLATYSATKHGVVGLSEAARAELRGSGVEVSVVMPGIVSTELTAGMKEARIKNLRPEQVAAEIVRALEFPRFDVFVPRSTGPLLAASAILPRRTREAIAHFLKADDVAVGVDPAPRATYEARAATSAPATKKVQVRDEPSEERTAA
jgi:NAD(P)-dependent dehydrogenase (short-subunit alcohol dehydrogenase family)